MFGMMDFRAMRSGLRRGREERLRLLTRGERAFLWSYTILSSLLAPVGVVLLVFGGSAVRGIALVCLFLGLLAMAVPISPFLRARVRRREAGLLAGSAQAGFRQQGIRAGLSQGDCRAPVGSRRRSWVVVDTQRASVRPEPWPTDRLRVSPSPAQDPTWLTGQHRTAKAFLPATRPASRPLRPKTSTRFPEQTPGLQHAGRKDRLRV